MLRWLAIPFEVNVLNYSEELSLQGPLLVCTALCGRDSGVVCSVCGGEGGSCIHTEMRYADRN